jgi:hypothetical protein
MSDTYSVSCQIDTTNNKAKLGLEIWLDDQLILDVPHVNEPIEFHKEFAEDESQHELRFVMKNKTPFDTRIDLEGNIIKDACLEIKKISFDGIELTYPVLQQIEYVHDFNGAGETVTNKFYQSMGCNGTATLKFATPIYLWLLENI